MKTIIIVNLIASIALTFSCNIQKNELKNKSTEKRNKILKRHKIKFNLTLLNTLYKKNLNNVISIKFYKKNSILLIYKSLFAYDDYDFNQSSELLKKIPFSKTSLENHIKIYMSKGFNERLTNSKITLFIQIYPSFLKLEKNGRDTFNDLYYRDKIENLINTNLNNFKLGRSVASDIGPGGMNLLFETTNWKKAYKIILNLLNKEGILSWTKICKVTPLKKDIQIYEIIFPYLYRGKFDIR